MLSESNIIAKVIRERVSIRSFLPDPVPREKLEMILEAARRAPSGENAQPWEFIIVQDEKNRQIIGDLARIGSGRRFTGEFINKSMDHRFEGLEDETKKKEIFDKLTSGSVSAFLAEAPLLIIVLGRLNVWDTPFDCAAAIQNMLLQAHSLGIGSCWVGAITTDVRDENKLKDLLSIPDRFKVIGIVALGYPVRLRGPRKRKPLQEMLHNEKYGQEYFPE